MQDRSADPQGARRSLERAVALEPERAATIAQLGIVLVKLQRLDDAEASFRQALDLDKDSVDPWLNLASCLRLQNRVVAAAEAYDEAVRRAPEDSEIWLALGRCRLAAAQERRAVEAFAKARALTPKALTPMILHANALVGAGDLEEGLALARMAAQTFPDQTAAQSTLADMLRALGQLDEAALAYRETLRLDPSDAAATLGLSLVSRPDPDDAIFERAEQRVDADDTSPQDRMILAFATGNLLDQNGRHEEAFARFQEGNRLKRSAIDFRIGRIESEFREAGSADSGPQLDTLPSSPRPILIVGMPRSGTTLVEQILASHPSVAAGGELPLLRRLVLDLPDLTGATSPADLTADQQLLCATRYLDALSERAGGRAAVTDKAPLNFRYLGWIAAMLPHAAIVHCLRDPLDTCVSCFCRLFGDGRAEFSYDLEELGTTYRLYRDLMDHWHQVLPGRVLDLSYEALVTDQEAVSRQLLDFCGLDWAPQVLDFHRTARAVRTASASQVRAPISSTSVGRWRRYETALGPLKTALGPYAEA